MGSNANNAMPLRETFGVEDAWTFTAREWTILNNPPSEKIVEKGTQTDMKLCGLVDCKCVVWGLAKGKCAFWFGMVVAETSVLEDRHNPQESILIGVGICHWFSELSVAGIEWSIFLLIPGWSTKDSSSDLLWQSPQVWVFVESVILLGSSASCFGSLYATWVFFGERLFGSSASKSIRLVGLRTGSRLGSLLGLLIGCCNWIKMIDLNLISSYRAKTCKWHDLPNKRVPQ